MKKSLAIITIFSALILFGVSKMVYADDALAPFVTILETAQKKAFEIYKPLITKPAEEQDSGKKAGAPNLNANSPTLSPVPVPVQQIPPQPRGNPPNPYVDSSRRNPWASSSRNNPWAKPPQPTINSPTQPPAYMPAPGPTNIYLPPGGSPP